MNRRSDKPDGEGLAAPNRQRGRPRAPVESASATLWERDPGSLRYTFVSPEAEVLLGYPVECWLHEENFWLRHVHPDDHERVREFWQLGTVGERQRALEYRMLAFDGRTVWLQDVMSVIKEDNRVVKLVGVMVDITAMKKTELELKYVSGLQRVLVEVSRDFLAGGAERFDERVNDSLARIGAYCGADRSYVFRFSADRTTHVNTHEWCAPGIERQIQTLQSVPNDALPALVAAVERREVVQMTRSSIHTPGWEAEHAFCQQYGIHSLIVVPIVVDDDVYGHIGFDSVSRARVWTDEEVRLLQVLANIIGAAIHRDRMEDSRHASDVRFRAIAEHLPGIVFQRVVDTDGRIRLSYVHAGEGPACGVDLHSVLAGHDVLLENIHPEDRVSYENAIRESARTLEAHDIEFRIRANDGSLRCVRSMANPRQLEDGSVLWDGIAIDETERKRAQARLREARVLLEIAGRTARLGGWSANLATQQLTWSNEVSAIHEMPPGTQVSLGEGIDFYAPEFRERISKAFWACARDGTPYDEELAIITARGNRVWVRAIGEAVRDAAGTIVEVRGAIQDISEQREAQEEIRRLAGRLTTTLESITDAILTVDHAWRITFINRAAETLVEHSRDVLLGKTLWEEFPQLAGTRIEYEYRRSVAEGVTVMLEEYYPPLGKWLEIRAYPSEEGLAIYFRDITERKRAQREIEFLALYDPLTRLPNRRLLRDRLQHSLATGARTGMNGAVLFLDLDHFKTLNDTLGHEVGDQLLQQVAKRLTTSLRDMDTVARFGGDEFVVVLADLNVHAPTAALRAKAVAQKILTALTRPYQLGPHERHMTVSIGITLFGGADDTADDLMKRVDLAMYRAKEAGRGTMRVYAPEMRAAVEARVRLEAELRKGLERGEITPHYQPQFDAAGRLMGAEALARWDHPEQGLVSPAEFIAVAEESGLILPLGEAMFEQVCSGLACWSKLAAEPLPSDFWIAVNVSARQFHHPGFVEQVKGVLKATGAPPQNLGLELTESLLLANVDEAIAKMDELKGLGIHFSLDDFGTGYSSLAYLKRLPLDQLKIDQTFVRDALTDPNDAAIVRAIILLADSLGLGVIAEGVETEETRAWLEGNGCVAYQGYLFSRPLPAARFQAFIADYNAG
ncbi:EAL domain-containing protein [Aquisalimonas sp.]|uniref:EAL domain-containing protein n=1 Tax=Aquisalimonas sp. TaxID=1872621 RepID=UPI0025B80ED1|nr:EAL domain-containing protein [Aquisalimonas sp.]